MRFHSKERSDLIEKLVRIILDVSIENRIYPVAGILRDSYELHKVVIRVLWVITVLMSLLVAKPMLAEATADIRKFTCPCTLDGPYSHFDGGSQSGTLIDNSGRTLEFVFNRSTGIDSGLPHRLYFGGHTWKTGRLVERGSEEEDAFVYLLLIWAYNNLRNESRVAYDEFKQRHNMKPHDSRQFHTRFPENEIRAMEVLNLVDSIRRGEDRVKVMW